VPELLATAGVRALIKSNPLQPGDHLTLVMAQAGASSVSSRSVGSRIDLRVPTVRPAGETGLSAALARVRSNQKQVALRPDRKMIILVTDGVNVFTEEKHPADLSDVSVVLVGGSCAAVPGPVRGRCLSADSAADVATQMTALMERSS
jgi:hypothetical protein